MKLTLYWVIFSILPATIPLLYPQGQTNYTMLDLTVLAKEKNYLEFFQHAFDLRPTERNSEWKELMQEMATGLLTHSASTKKFDRDRFLFIEKIAQWPVLANDHLVQKARIAYAQEYFTYCWGQEHSQLCLGDLTTHFASLPPPVDPVLALFYGQLLEKQAPDASWQFYQEAANSDMARTLCGEQPLQQAILQRATALFATTQFPEQMREKLAALARPECWQQLHSSLRSDLFSKEVSRRQYAYWQLKWNKALDPEEEDFFLMHFFLQTPILGDTFNRAWNLLKALGQNYQRRQHILKRLSFLDPLPGKIFQTPSAQDRKIYLELLATNFPEYLDLYSTTCLNYLQGKAKFPRGNPTLECQELFATARGTDWIRWEKQQTMQKIFPH